MGVWGLQVQPHTMQNTIQMSSTLSYLTQCKIIEQLTSSVHEIENGGEGLGRNVVLQHHCALHRTTTSLDKTRSKVLAVAGKYDAMSIEATTANLNGDIS